MNDQHEQLGRYVFREIPYSESIETPTVADMLATDRKR